MTFTSGIAPKVSVNNSTTTPLGASATFTGTAESIVNYGFVSVYIFSDVGSLNSGVFLEFSSDGSNWDVRTSLTYSNLTKAFTGTFKTTGSYFRIVYQNGSVAQSQFRLQTILREDSEDDDPIGIPQSFTDAFNRFRVSQPQTLLDLKHIDGLNSQFEAERIVGSGTINWVQATSSVTLATTANGASVTRQSRRYLTYQSGKSLLILCTGVLNFSGSNGSDVTTRIGYFDDDNGVFFYCVGTNTTGVCIRNNGVDNLYPRTLWNIDKMDGTGPSRITLDPSKSQIFLADLEWLGVGSVRFGLVLNDHIYYVHQQNHANITNAVYTRTPNLPIRYQITATGPNATGSMSQICSSVQSEGGYQPVGKLFGVSTASTLSVGAVNEVPLLTVALRSGRRALVLPQGASVLVTSGGNIKYNVRLFLAPSSVPVTGGTFQDVNTTYSAVQYNNSATAFDAAQLANSIIIMSDFATGTTKTNDIFFGEGDIVVTTGVAADALDYLVISAVSLSANQSVAASLNWMEVS